MGEYLPLNIYYSLNIQLREQGFRHIDALDPSEEMMNVARTDKLYEKYFCEFLTEKQLPIESSKYSNNMYKIPLDRKMCLFYLYNDPAQRAYGAKMASYRRRCEVITSHRC